MAVVLAVLAGAGAWWTAKWWLTATIGAGQVLSGQAETIIERAAVGAGATVALALVALIAVVDGLRSR